MNEYLDLLRLNRDFRNLWLGSVISQFGDWFNVLAAAEIITHLTNSGVALSYLFVSRFLPLFLFSPVAGVLADRFNRKHIMVLSDALRGVTVLGFLFIRDPSQIWFFYLLTATQFTLSALFTPARGAMLAATVKPGELVAANTLDSVTWSTMLALGAFAGGVFTAFFGANIAFLADSASFLLSAYFIARISISGHPLDAPVELEPALDAGPGYEMTLTRNFTLLDGFRYLLNEPFILGVALAKAAGSLVWGAINVLEITFANDLFPLVGAERFGISDPGTATLGLIYVFSGIGTGLGPLVIRRVLGDSPRRMMLGITVGFLFLTGGVAWLARVGSLGPLLAGTMLRTIGTGTLWVFASALLQTTVPDKFRGRVFSFEFAALTLTQSISALVGGRLLDSGQFSIQGVMGVAALTSVAMTALWVLFHLRHARTLRA